MANNIKVKIKKISVDLKSPTSEILKKIGIECSEDLKKTSPKRKNGGEYARGWTYKFEADKTRVVVFNNGKEKTLTHLLELGHRTKNGGHVPPNEHIRPAYNREKNKYIEDLKKIKLEFEKK